MIRSFACLALASALAAQVQTTAHVQRSTLGTNGNVAPLGCSATGLFAEAHSQILIPAQYLPGPGAVLLGLGALGRSSAGTNTTLTYGLLRIRVARTTATSLQATFASNLVQPQTLLDVANLTVDWQANAFTPITFLNSYVHDGQSSLVLDIQKIVSPIGDAGFATIQNSRRTDLPRMINAFGGAGSGAHAATTASVLTNSPISLELRWAGFGGARTPTVQLKSDPTAAFRAPFGIGNPVDTIVQGEPGALFANFESLVATPGVAVPGLIGQVWIADPILFDIGVLSAAGQHTTTQVLPNDPAWIGLYLAFQSLLIEPDDEWRLTNLADCFVSNGL
ncbi:MAG: hypothetical protein KF830_06840 [Planctomycetes bacterium]|nr:hypothetical protein [Planctomycetota bacterium]